MGTRGIFGFKVNDKHKMMYCHFDSYPEGLGNDLVDEIKSFISEFGADFFISKTKELVLNMQAICRNDSPTESQIKHCEPWTDLGVSQRSTSDWYCLLRLTQGSFKKSLKCGYYEEFNNRLENPFDLDYAYVMNLDTERFEVYINRKGNFKEIGNFSLFNIPTNWLEEMVYH